MSLELKIKSKHLALEPAIIKKEEDKLRKQINNYRQHYQIPKITLDVCRAHPILITLFNKEWKLRDHRMRDVRFESRATFLARAYLKGIPYKVVEQKSKLDGRFNHYIFPRVFEMVAKYSDTPILKYWNGTKAEYRQDEKEKLTAELKAWFGIE